MAPKIRKRSTSTPRSKKKVSDHPDHLFPLVLTSATQELFGCRADDDVTEQSPYKLLKKDSILQDVKTRAAASDFSPVKQIVKDYPEEEILLVFDSDLTYGQSFYLVLTPEAKNQILTPPEAETPEVFGSEVNKTPEPKQWVSLDSEKEIDEESIKDTREKLKIQVLRKRRTFGQPVCFSDRSANDSFVEVVSHQDSRSSIKIRTRDCGVQNVPVLRSSNTQTYKARQRNTFTQYSPRELSKEDMERVLQDESLKDFCNTVTPRILHALQQENVENDDWKALLTEFENHDGDGRVSEYLRFHNFFSDQQYTKDKEISCMNWHPTIDGVIAVALMDKKEMENEEENENKSAVSISKSSFIVFYSFSDISKAQLVLKCPHDVQAFDFCPSNPNIIVGGCVNGQVVLWDISAHAAFLQGIQSGSKTTLTNADTFSLKDSKENKTPVVPLCASSSKESSHKGLISDVKWLPPTFQVTRTGLPVENDLKISVQLVTCSSDCSIMFWDVRLPHPIESTLSTRKLIVDQKTPRTTNSIPETFKHLDGTWKPLFRVVLPKTDTDEKYVPLKFSLEDHSDNDDTEKKGCAESIPSYRQLIIPSSKTLNILEDVNTKFYVGTEKGEVIYTDWKLEKDEFGRLHSPKPLLCFQTDYLCVNSMQRSPFFEDTVLTTGGSHFAIWKEDVKNGPLVVSPYSEQQCTTGCWSLSRPAVFFIGKEDGSIEVWNLLEAVHKPSKIDSLMTKAKITCMKPRAFSPKQHFLAVTNDLGGLHVFEIPKILYAPSRHEKSNVKKYFELEMNAMKHLQFEEVLTKQQNKGEQLIKKTEPDKPVDPLMELQDLELESDFLKLEKLILKGCFTHTHNT